MTSRPSRRQLLLALPAACLAACTAARRQKAVPATTAAGPPPEPSPPSRLRRAAGLAAFVAHGPRTRPLVALTFHGSGDLALLDQLLEVAASHRAPLTIFAVGQWLDANPGVAHQLLAAGHELANHTYTHPALGRVSPRAAASARMPASAATVPA